MSKEAKRQRTKAAKLAKAMGKSFEKNFQVPYTPKPPKKSKKK